MKVATVDIGTNSMRLLIADYENNKIFNRKKYVEVTRIGKGVDEKGMISGEAINLNSSVLEKFISLAKSKRCEKIRVIGTSALRDSKNSDEFIKKAYEKTGVNIEIISGEMEANLGFLGIKSILDEKKYTLTIDIGGGSTEFILGNRDGELVFSKSENIGVVRLTERFLKLDIPSDIEIIEMDKYIETVIGDTIDVLKRYDIGKFIGIGGTATSISSMIQKMEIYCSDKIHNSKIYYDELLEIYKNLKKMTLEEKKMIVGLQAKRADVIFTGVCIMKKIMSMLDIEYVTVSEYDNLEGMIYFMM
jgi:ppx/gppA family phosphatase